MQLCAQTIIQTRFTCYNIVFKCVSKGTREAQQVHGTEMAGSNGKAEAVSYKPVLSAEQVITTTLKCAISQCYQSSDKKQLGFYQIKWWDCFHRAYRDCKEQR